MGDINFDFSIKGMDHLEKLLESLDNPKPINKAIRSTGKTALSVIQNDVPNKSGDYKKSLKAKAKQDGKFISVTITPTTPHGHALWGYGVYGTNQRFKQYQSRAKDIKYRQPVSTGKMGGKQEQFKHLKDIEELLKTSIERELFKIK